MNTINPIAFRRLYCDPKVSRSALDKLVIGQFKYRVGRLHSYGESWIRLLSW